MPPIFYVANVCFSFILRQHLGHKKQLFVQRKDKIENPSRYPSRHPREVLKSSGCIALHRSASDILCCKCVFFVHFVPTSWTQKQLFVQRKYKFENPSRYPSRRPREVLKSPGFHALHLRASDILCCKCVFFVLLYDGLPSENPVLKMYSPKLIDGDVSLLIYFPFNGFDSSDDKMNPLEDDVPTTSSKKNDKSSIKTTKKYVNVNVDEIPCKSSQEKTGLAGVPANQEISDHLLAKALFDIENDDNTYKKTLGKSYKQIKVNKETGISSVTLTPSPDIDKKQRSPSINMSSSPSSTSSSIDEEIDIKQLLNLLMRNVILF